MSKTIDLRVGDKVRLKDGYCLNYLGYYDREEFSGVLEIVGIKKGSSWYDVFLKNERDMKGYITLDHNGLFGYFVKEEVFELVQR